MDYLVLFHNEISPAFKRFFHIKRIFQADTLDHAKLMWLLCSTTSDSKYVPANFPQNRFTISMKIMNKNHFVNSRWTSSLIRLCQSIFNYGVILNLTNHSVSKSENTIAIGLVSIQIGSLMLLLLSFFHSMGSCKIFTTFRVKRLSIARDVC